MDETELETVLEAAQQGSRVAFKQIYEHYFLRVLGLCRKILRSDSLAEDAANEVFERSLRALDQYDRSRPFDRWLLTIAARHCLNRLRSERTQARLFCEAPAELPGETERFSPLVAYENNERRAQLIGAIDSLPENYRVPLVLKYYGELSYDEIAAELGTSHNNVAVLLHRAKRELRKRIAGGEFTELRREQP